MDKLTRTIVFFFIVTLVIGLGGLFGGGYLLHTAINQGDFWKGLVGSAAAVIGFYCLSVIVMTRG